jgi:DNA helicase HerA-like ATPase
MMNPRLYATFLLWLMSELFEVLPEVGDPDKPKLVFFFDEAHLLFNDAPKVLTERVEQVVRLIRSKGVGVYFVTQNPLDVPETVLAQLGNRVQHALRAYSPREQKAVKTAADTFRPNPAFDCATVITTLGTGEALVSTLEAKGAPSIVERTLIRPPSGRVGPLTDAERQQVMDHSPVLGVYDEDLDRESAFEILAARAKKAAESEAAKQAQEAQPTEAGTTSGWSLPGFGGGDDDNKQSGQGRGRSSGYQRETVVEAAMKSVARTVATQVGRALVRPPSGRVGPLTDAERQQVMDKSPVLGVYDEDVDRESAFEILAARAQKASDSDAAKQAQPTQPTEGSASGRWTLPGFGDDDKDEKPAQGRPRSGGYQRETVVEAAMKSVARTVATQVGRALVRGILGSLKR